MVALAQQKRMAFKEKVTFYSDEQKTMAAFSFRAEKVMDIHGRYIVEDPSGNVIGMFRKEFKKSLLRSSWILMTAEGKETVRVQESSEALAVLRRFAGLVPIIGDLIEMVVVFLKYHFSFVRLDTNEEVGKYQKTTLFRDHYTLSMTDAAYAELDWRVYAAMGVGLDALQSR